MKMACRVLIIGPPMEIVGGQSVQLASLLKKLQQEPELHVDFYSILPKVPFLFAWMRKVKYLRSICNFVFYVLGLIRCRHYDVLHVYSASYWSFLLAPAPAIFAGKLFRKKVILNYHSGEAEDHLRNWRSALPIIRMADAVVAPSGYLVKVFGDFGVQAECIFNTVETDHFHFRERRKLRPLLFANRNLEPLYNVACVLRAFAIIQKSFPDASLQVLGDGSERARLEELARTLGLRNVRFDGRVAHHEMPNFYDAADIYLNTPNIDNMPVSILESFAAGVPVVTTDAGGIPYIVADGQTGLIARCDDHEGIAVHAIRLLEDPDLAARIVSNARAEIARYAWANVRRQWIAAYTGQSFPVGAASRPPARA